MLKKQSETVKVLGIISSIFFFVAGIVLALSGNELTTLRSVGGTSIAEAYYQEIGRYGIAYSLIAFALGFFSLAISIGISKALWIKENS